MMTREDLSYEFPKTEAVNGILWPEIVVSVCRRIFSAGMTCKASFL
ncbi:hypothetical protein EDC39_106199 [Geothermobacter ehrlichii]|uniref:Uncharacterized protein n=1 Tax=Geothermobacter ehrlichii TaxID=213224 RepID=A0A5D3WKI8_9BACT|nr:hypothetical protein EDC39_106199 [Geothermobacter ehrlichii]